MQTIEKAAEIIVKRISAVDVVSGSNISFALE